MKKILITGGSGFIGTNVVQFYLDHKYTVLSIDKKTPQVTSHNSVYREVDIEDEVTLAGVLEEFQPNYIIHLAARTDLRGETLCDYSSNSKGVENVLKVSSQLQNLKKILITSSMLVCHVGYKPQNQFDYSPSTLYGQSKVETERLVWNNKPRCDWAILRPTSIWGPWFDVPYRNFFDMVSKRRYFHIGHNSCTKTYGYVGNAVYQIHEILMNETYSETNKVFYIGDYSPVNIEDWANEIGHELNNRVYRLPLFVFKGIALLGDFLKLMNITFPMTSFRLRNMTTDNVVDLSNTFVIAPHPPYTRLEGIKETIEWMKQN